LNCNWNSAPLVDPEGQSEADIWKAFEERCGDGFGAAVVALNATVEAEWQLEKSSIAEKFATFLLAEMSKMKNLFVKDTYYARASHLGEGG
jgi:hypothetical protein